MYNAATWLVDRHVAAGSGGRTAIVCGAEQLTYADVQQQVWRAQHALTALDVRREERVAMVVNDEPAFVAWFLGSLRSAVVPVPLSTMLTGEELGAIIADAGAAIVVVSAAYASCLPAIAKHASDLRAAVVIGDAQADAVVPVHRWSEFDDAGEAPVAPTKPDSPAFW